MKRLLVFGVVLCSIIFGCYSPSANNKNATIILPDTTHSYNRDTVFSVRSLHDTVGILRLCFSPIKIINKKIACWKPSLDDFFNMPVSDDGLCHTKIDTVINLSAEKSLIVFRTDSYHSDNNIIDCHACSPVYGITTVKKEDNIYTVANFKKDLIAAGSFGNGYDTLTVEKFGKDYQLLRFSSSYVGTATNTLTNTYFELENFQQVFSYFPHREFGDSTDFDFNPDYSEIQQLLVHIPGKYFRDGIELKGTIRYFNKSKKKIESKNTIEYYREDDFGNFKRALQ